MAERRIHELGQREEKSPVDSIRLDKFRDESECFFNNSVFPCGYTLGAEEDTINLYYGGADTNIAVAEGSIAAMLRWLKEKR